MNTTFSPSAAPSEGHRHGVFSLSRLLMFAAAVILLASCSKSNEDKSLDLLSTVPADADCVALVNMNTLISQTGGKVKDGSVVQADRLLELVKRDLRGDQAKIMEWLLSPESGVDCTSAVVFYYKSRPYASAFISDEKKLRAGIDKAEPGEWKTNDKVAYKDGMAILDGRLWIVPGDDEVSMVPTFANLSEVESFRSNKYAAELSAATDAMAAWASVEGVLRMADLRFSEQTTARLALNMAFSTPRYLTSALNVNKDGVSMEVGILNDEMQPAKCELALGKIDSQLVASLGGNADSVLAIAVSPKLVKQILAFASSLGGSMPKEYAVALEALDGTTAVAMNSSIFEGSITGLRMKGAVQTSGKNNAALLKTLEDLFPQKMTVDGNTFRFADEGYGNGIAPLADVAKEFDGAWIGMQTAQTLPDGRGKGALYVTLRPAGQSLTLNLKFILK